MTFSCARDFLSNSNFWTTWTLYAFFLSQCEKKLPLWSSEKWLRFQFAKSHSSEIIKFMWYWFGQSLRSLLSSRVKKENNRQIDWDKQMTRSHDGYELFLLIVLQCTTFYVVMRKYVKLLQMIYLTRARQLTNYAD